MTTARKLTSGESKPKTITIGVVGTCDPRVDEASRQRAGNIVKTLADLLAAQVRTPDGQAVDVAWTPILVDGEPQADQVGRQFREAGVDAVVCAPDTWAFPQLTLISLLAHLPPNVPVNITCGNSGPKPGVVYAHAVNGALAQTCRLAHLNVGTWPDTGADPKPTDSTVASLVDWAYAAVTYAGLKGRRVVVFGHDSMGMETALTHVIPTRQTFGLEVARLDMKLLADMLNKGAYDKKEAAALRGWIDQHIGKRLDLSQPGGEEKFNQSLALYLIIRDLMAELNAVGGGFMNQLEWGSDRRGIPLPIADVMESLFNSTFDHNGKKTVLPFATEADTQGLLTMLFCTWLSGGNPPLFMDFRKVWEPWEIQGLAQNLGIPFGASDLWAQKGIVDGNNSGSASFDWAGRPGDSVEKIMPRISLPGAELYYFPGGGNSVTFFSPGGIECLAGRLTYSELSGMFSMVWDEASTVDLPEKLADAVAHTSNWSWPHTFIVPKYASMGEYKQYAPANHFHATWGLKPGRLQYWMDMTNVLSATPWSQRPQWIEGLDRPQPLLFVLNGGENNAKILRARGR
jgi:L-fucose/D-arabinose isomerase